MTTTNPWLAAAEALIPLALEEDLGRGGPPYYRSTDRVAPHNFYGFTETLWSMSDKGLPPNPGFYHHPQDINGVVDFVVARILDQLGVKHQLMARWGEKSE